MAENNKCLTGAFFALYLKGVRTPIIAGLGPTNVGDPLERSRVTYK